MRGMSWCEWTKVLSCWVNALYGEHLHVIKSDLVIYYFFNY